MYIYVCVSNTKSWYGSANRVSSIMQLRLNFVKEGNLGVIFTNKYKSLLIDGCADCCC